MRSASRSILRVLRQRFLINGYEIGCAQNSRANHADHSSKNDKQKFHRVSDNNPEVSEAKAEHRWLYRKDRAISEYSKTKSCWLQCIDQRHCHCFKQSRGGKFAGRDARDQAGVHYRILADNRK